MYMKQRIDLFLAGGSLRAGLSAASPPPPRRPCAVRAFRCYPCRGALVLWAFALAYTAQAQVLSLDSVVARIDRNNLMLQEYDSKANAWRAYAEGATAWMAPMAGAGTFMMPYANESPMHERDKGAWMFSVEQQIPNPAKVRAAKNALQSKAAIEQAARAQQFNTLRAEAKMLYYQWLAAEQKRQVLADNRRTIAFMQSLARLRYANNQGALGDVYRLDSKLAEAENMQLMALADIREKSVRLKALLNMAPADSIMIDTATVVQFHPQQVANDTAALDTQRSDILRLDRTIASMQLDRQVQRQQAKPDLRIRFDHMQPLGDMSTQFTAMAMVSIPIAPWSSKMYKAEAKGMQHDIHAMQQSRRALLTETRGMVAAMAGQLTTMQRQLHNYETRILPALRKNYQALMLAYEENREQMPMVLDGWEALTMAQLELLDKKEAYYTMIVRYEKELEK